MGKELVHIGIVMGCHCPVGGPGKIENWWNKNRLNHSSGYPAGGYNAFYWIRDSFAV